MLTMMKYVFPSRCIWASVKQTCRIEFTMEYLMKAMIVKHTQQKEFHLKKKL